MVIILEQLGHTPDLCGAFRRIPLVFSRFSRGGKTTVLISLFNHYLDAREGRYGMIISLNGSSGFVRNEDEPDVDCLMRLIAAQLVDKSRFTDMQNIKCSEELIDRLIDEQTKSSGGVFTLFIDELNVLGNPVSYAATKMLRRLFLSKNRYLVFTTHIPHVLLDEPEQAGTTNVQSGAGVMEAGSGSDTNIMVVPMPQSIDLTELRKIDHRCSNLTPHQATICGGVPSLIYSTIHDQSFADYTVAVSMSRFSTKYGLEAAQMQQCVKTFASVLISGDLGSVSGTPIAFFERFASIPEKNKLRWVLCYFASILKTLSQHAATTKGNEIISEIKTIANQELPVYAHTVQLGLDWQCVVDLAILLRALVAVLSEGEHLLLPGFQVKDVKLCPMPPEIQTLEAGRAFIQQAIASAAPGTLLIVRSNFAKYPLFDGFMVYVMEDIAASIIVGQQTKLGRNLPKKSVPEWVNGGGYVIRGNATNQSYCANGWTYCDEASIKNFLGYSLESLYPSSWYVPPDASLFD